MNSIFTGLAVPILLVVAFFAFFMYGSPDSQLVAVNGLETRDLGKLVSLTNSQSNITGTRYDSFESPRGINYQVPADQTLYIAHIDGQPSNVGGLESIQIGYSTETVDNQVAIPTGGIVAYEMTMNTTTSLPEQHIFVVIPAGMYPWIRINGAGNIQATGFLRKTY